MTALLNSGWLSCYVIILFVVGCGDNESAPNFMRGRYDLFHDVKVDADRCESNTFSATLTLETSQFADSDPNEIRVLHWDYLTDVWTEVQTLQTEVDTPKEYDLDLEAFGGCQAQGSSLVFVPGNERAYGSPEFITLDRGLASGAGTSYSRETRTNDVQFFCPLDAIDRAQAQVYNFKRRQVRATVALSATMSNGEGFLDRERWSGGLPSIDPSEDVIIFVGHQTESLMCSYLL
jgi:hypothetical protein